MFQEAFGVNAHIRDVAERFAAQGFLAIAPELFHRTAPGFDCAYSDFAKAMPQLAGDHRSRSRRRRARRVRRLEREGVGAQHRVGRLLSRRPRRRSSPNSGLALKAAVSYYGGRIPTVIHRAPKLSGPMMFCLGRARSPHSRRTAAGRDRPRARREQDVRRRRVFERRPRVLLRRASELPSRVRRASVEPHAHVSRTRTARRATSSRFERAAAWIGDIADSQRPYITKSREPRRSRLVCQRPIRS